MLSDYLTGEKFSNHYEMNLNTLKRWPGIPDRIEWLVDIVKGKKIIDLGFADHIEVMEKKIRDNRWLHKRLSDSAEKCLGIDNNEDAVEYCKRWCSVSDVICVDLFEKINEEIYKNDWDYLILGEIIEHQNNPIGFLYGLGYYNTIKKYILTTPNAFRIENFLWATKHKELINSDHRYWFTPYTLSKVVHEAGRKVNWLGFCQSSPIPFYKPFKKLLLNKYPAFRDTIIMEIE